MRFHRRMIRYIALIWTLVLPQMLAAQVTAAFSASANSGCPPLIVSFTNQSSATGNITLAYTWDDGTNYSTLQNPVLAYTSPGTYVVTLTAYDANNSSVFDTETMSITVYQKPNVVFNFSPNTGCAPLEVTFNSSSSTAGSGSITSRFWDFGDGNTGSGTGPSHTYTTGGTYTPSLKITNSFGCSKTVSATTNIVASSGPTASFSSSTSQACSPPLTVNFYANASGGASPYTYSWDLGTTTSTAANPSVSYTSSGVYNITLIVTDNAGCSDTITQSNYVAITDVEADFDVTTPACKGVPISITQNTLGATSYSWNWGDNSTGSGATPSKSYASGGTYTITLTAASGTCSDSHTETIQIQEITPSFTTSPTYSCEQPHLFYYTNTSTLNFGSIAYHEWHHEIWDYNSSTGVITTVEIDTAGNDSIIRDEDDLGYFADTLIVVSNIGCTATVNMQNNVLVEIMQAGFVPDPNDGCAPQSVDFTDTSVPTTQYAITNWWWDFGQGSTSTLQHPTGINYVDTGCYDIKLVIENAFGCRDSMIANEPSSGVCFGSLPIAAATFTEDTACASDSIYFYDASLDTVANQWYWEFSDGTVATGDTVKVQFQDTGWIHLTYIVGHHGCNDTIEYDSVIYIQGPLVNFMHVNDCDTPGVRWFHPIEFSGVQRWRWNFGDGSALDSINTNPIHEYDTSGTFQVGLTAWNDSNGCTYSKTGSVSIRFLHAEFNISNFNELPIDSVACSPSAFQFDAAPSRDELNQYIWIYGNDTSSNIEQVEARYFNTPGYHTIRMRIHDSNGCWKEAKRRVFLSDPTANFSYDYTGGCDPVTIAFDESSSSDTNLVAWNWNFGDGDTSTIINPNHIYENQGTYQVTLEVEDAIGCTASKTKSVLVKFPFVAFDVDTIVCEKSIVHFLNLSSGDSLLYHWNFGNGSTNYVQHPPPMIYTQPGTFDVFLAVEDDLGCKDTAFTQIHVKPKPDANFTADTTHSPCMPLFVTFSDSSIGDIATWKWTFGDGTGSVLLDTSIAYHIYNSTGDFDVTLEVETEFGCKDNIKKSDFIQVSGPYATFDIAPDSTCIGLPIKFFVTDRIRMAKYTWVYGDGHDTTVLGSVDTVTHAYDRVGVRTPIVVYYDSSESCQIPYFDSVYIHEVMADFKAFPDSVGCARLNTTMKNHSLGADYWRWTLHNSKIRTEKEPQVYYPFPGEYEVELYIENIAFGCKDSVSKWMKIHELPDVVASDDTLLCRGDSALVFGQSKADTVTWSWRPSHAVANDSQRITFAFPDTTTYLKVMATDTNGCTGVDSILITVQDTPRINMFFDTTVVVGEVVVIEPRTTDQVTYQWFPPSELSCDNCPYPAFTADGSQTFSLLVKDIHGCFEKEYEFTINVDEKYSLDVPDAFSPDGDGINDIIYARGWGIKEVKEFRIYNRWGQEVFYSDNIHRGWDGNFRGKAQEMDTYAYIIRVLQYDGDEKVKEGLIELIR